MPPVLHDLLLAMLAKLPTQRPTMPEVIRRLDVVRDELEQRRQARAVAAPRQATAALISRSQPNRVSSAAGLSETELAAWRSGTRRWQYVIGAFALAASATLFWLSRVGDQAASAATAGDASATTAADPELAPPVALNSRALPLAARPVGSDVALREDPAIDATEPSTQVVLRPIPVAARAEAPTAKPSPARATPHRSTASRPTPARNSPAAPRRRAKLDPDGTLDPYR
jgi:hypothetical protein